MSNDNLLARTGDDTAENEPLKVCKRFEGSLEKVCTNIFVFHVPIYRPEKAYAHAFHKGQCDNPFAFHELGYPKMGWVARRAMELQPNVTARVWFEGVGSHIKKRKKPSVPAAPLQD